MEFAVFAGETCLGGGDLPTAVRLANACAAGDALILETATGRSVDVDPREPQPSVDGHQETISAKPGRGRPKLGVTAREVTLLPRHWDWLATQPGGASAALRRLVDQARRETEDADNRRKAQEAVYRLATTLGGDRPGYEDAIRALFAGDIAGFQARISAWPADIAAYLSDVAAPLKASVEPPAA